MKKRYKSNKNRAYNKRPKSFGKRNSNNRNPNYSRKRAYQRSNIRHEQYISKATASNTETLYVKDKTFSDYNLEQIIQKNIREKGYIHPTKIQNEAIPEILQNRDILGMASTGSGKTAAFLLPMITKALRHSNEKCLIVVPTRELANQIRHEFKTFSKGTNLREVLVIGGTAYGTQIQLLRKKPQFVIATPGRLIDLHEHNKINLKSFNNIVLDEVDQMLDMGFIRDIELIVSNLSDHKQSMFFSATMNYKAENIAKSLLRNPVKIQVEQQSASLNVDQNIVKFKYNSDKINVLHELLIKTDYHKVLVFSKTRRGADLVAKQLQERGHKIAVIHGQKSLGQRNKVMSQFRQQHVDILVATDVAARGIDVPNISHIINYDEPANYNDYIHRIGRTGRIGKKGFALTFVK